MDGTPEWLDWMDVLGTTVGLAAILWFRGAAGEVQHPASGRHQFDGVCRHTYAS